MAVAVIHCSSLPGSSDEFRLNARPTNWNYESTYRSLQSTPTTTIYYYHSA